MPESAPRTSASTPAVTVREEDGVSVVRVDGEIDLASAETLGRGLREAGQTGLPVLVDLGGCTFLDSTAVAALFRARRHAAGIGRECAIACPPGGIPARVLAIAGASLVPVHDSRAAARRALGGGTGDAGG